MCVCVFYLHYRHFLNELTKPRLAIKTLYKEKSIPKAGRFYGRESKPGTVEYKALLLANTSQRRSPNTQAKVFNSFEENLIRMLNSSFHS